MKTILSSAAKMNALKRGLIAGSISLITYLFVVIVTTPNLPALAALNAVVKVNGIIVFGLAIAIGTQIYMSSYAKSLGCCVLNKRKGMAGSSTSTALSSFFSFFSLVPLGCCGSWLLILSLLPSFFGSSLSVILIQYSEPLSYLGLVIVIGYTAIVAIKLKRKLEMIESDKAEEKVSFM
jgi:nitrogen fixation/metabolism regulation signal transduction histidine kinase